MNLSRANDQLRARTLHLKRWLMINEQWGAPADPTWSHCSPCWQKHLYVQSSPCISVQSIVIAGFKGVSPRLRTSERPKTDVQQSVCPIGCHADGKNPSALPHARGSASVAKLDGLACESVPASRLSLHSCENEHREPTPREEGRLWSGVGG